MSDLEKRIERSRKAMTVLKNPVAAAEELKSLRQQLEQAEEENERVRQGNLDVMMHFEDMKAEKERLEARVEKHKNEILKIKDEWFCRGAVFTLSTLDPKSTEYHECVVVPVNEKTSLFTLTLPGAGYSDASEPVTRSVVIASPSA
jgi:ferredoxin-NADP reductase